MAKESLTIWIPEAWADRPEVKALVEAGHVVEYLEPQATYDLILHPNAWRWSDDLFPHLDVTIKEAKAQKYGDARKQARIEAKARKNASGSKRPKRAEKG